MALSSDERPRKTRNQINSKRLQEHDNVCLIIKGIGDRGYWSSRSNHLVAHIGVKRYELNFIDLNRINMKESA